MEWKAPQSVQVGLLVASSLCLASAPLILPDSYSVVSHTTSESAAQATEGAWLARTGFLLFGAGVIWMSVTRRRWGTVGRVAHRLFGFSMVAVAVYSHRPFIDSLPVDEIEDLLHSVGATVMGFAFVAGVLAAALARRQFRLWDWLAVVTATLVPFGMGAFGQYDGLLQRLMFAVAYVWYSAEALSPDPDPMTVGSSAGVSHAGRNPVDGQE